MSAFDEPSRPEDFPAHDATTRLLSALLEGFIATRATQTEAVEFLQRVAQVLADRDRVNEVVVRFRRHDRQRQLARAMADRQAVALFREILETCVSRIPKDGEGDE